MAPESGLDDVHYMFKDVALSASAGRSLFDMVVSQNRRRRLIGMAVECAQVRAKGGRMPATRCPEMPVYSARVGAAFRAWRAARM
jgi:hypothetical protein